MDIGIEEKDRKAISAALALLLADTYTLYLKTHNFHWNVTGPMFNTLHLMFEQQYTEMATAVDEIAERIRALGEFAPRQLLRIRQVDAGGGGDRRPESRGDDEPARARSRDRRPHRAGGLPVRR